HVFVQTDFDNAVFEKNFDDNNTRRTTAPIDVTRRPDPDLQVSSVTGPDSGQPGQTVSVTWTVTNAGPGLAHGPWIDKVFLSSDGTLTNAVLLRSVTHSVDLSSGSSYDASATVILPDVSDGAYQIVVSTDGTNLVFEGDSDANNLGASSSFSMAHADLRPSIVSAPSSAESGSSISVTWS